MVHMETETEYSIQNCIRNEAFARASDQVSGVKVAFLVPHAPTHPLLRWQRLRLSSGISLVSVQQNPRCLKAWCGSIRPIRLLAKAVAT